MADSSITICNRALALLGSSSFIASLDEESAQAKQCNIQYEPARKQVLEDFDWPFAGTFVTLTEYGTAPNQWGYQYMYPTDCIKAREICFGTRVADPPPFRVGNLREDGNNRRVIWTDVEDAQLYYTFDFETVPFMPQTFQEVLAAKLAYTIALPLTRKERLQTAMANYYGAMLAHAQVLAGNEGEEDVNERKATWHEQRNAGYDLADLPSVIDPNP